MTVGLFAPDANPILRWCAGIAVIGLASFLAGAFFAVVNAMLHWRSARMTFSCPPPIPHRRVTSFKEPAARGFERQRLNAVVSISARRS